MEEINKLGAADVTPRLAARDKSASMSRPSSVFILTPKEILPANRDRLLVHVRNGGYVHNPGEAGTAKTTLMATYSGVISFDYACRTIPTRAARANTQAECNTFTPSPPRV